jgi:transcriptional regulator with XRE-family HTH domain
LRPSEHGSEIVEKTMTADKATARQADLPVIEIGTKIRFTRRLRSLTLKEVAAATGCSESLLSKIENGHASPSLKMLQRLTHALGLTVGQLFAQEANPDDIVMRAATRVAFDTELGGQKPGRTTGAAFRRASARMPPAPFRAWQRQRRRPAA